MAQLVASCMPAVALLHRHTKSGQEARDLSISKSIGATARRCIRKVKGRSPIWLLTMRRYPGNTGSRAPSVQKLVPEERSIALNGPSEAPEQAAHDRLILNQEGAAVTACQSAVRSAQAAAWSGPVKVAPQLNQGTINGDNGPCSAVSQGGSGRF